MKLLLIEAINLRCKIGRSFVSFGIGYIAAYLKKHIPSLEIRVINHNIAEALSSFKPDIVGISSVTQNYGIAKDIARMCKNESYLVVMGGRHITALPKSLDSYMDAGVIGEGEETMLEIVNLIEKDGFDKEKLRNINGIVYRDSDRLVNLTPCRQLFPILDEIPYPNRDLLGFDNRTTMITSRGCPYKCIFCSSTRMWPNVRYFSAKYVIGEIKLLYEKYNSHYINIWDDLFIADKPRLKEIIALLRQEGLLGKIEFYLYVRANLINEEMARLLKEMNVAIATMGLESMSEPVLHYLKANVLVEQNEEAVKILNSFGIKANGGFIVGSPQETEDDILRTLNFVKGKRLHNVAAYLLTPLPGTPVWEYAKLKGLVSDEMDWNKLDINFKGNLKDSIILSERLSRERLGYYLKLFQKESRKKETASMIKRLYSMIIDILLNPGKIKAFSNLCHVIYLRLRP